MVLIPNELKIVQMAPLIEMDSVANLKRCATSFILQILSYIAVVFYIKQAERKQRIQFVFSQSLEWAKQVSLVTMCNMITNASNSGITVIISSSVPHNIHDTHLHRHHTQTSQTSHTIHITWNIQKCKKQLPGLSVATVCVLCWVRLMRLTWPVPLAQ